jgi:hypothetical protein
MPILVVIDTETNSYYIKLLGYFKAWIEVREDLKLKMRILFFRKTYKPFQFRQKAHIKKSGLKRKPDIKRMMILIRNLLKSIKIRKLDANIDTGDFPLNALLVPVAQKINNRIVNIAINFQEINNLYFIAETQLYKLIILYIKSRSIIKN